MSPFPIQSVTPLRKADAALVDVDVLARDLRAEISGEVRMDKISRALYATDASVYQIEPLGVVLPNSAEDLVRLVQICAKHRCPLTLRGGGTSQAGQAIGAGLVADTSKYLNRILELNVEQRWARVEPGIVLAELNAALRPHGLRFAPDISTASRATVGGMMANNSAGARSVLYGKTIDHVLEQRIVLSDGSVVHCRPLSSDSVSELCTRNTLEATCYSTVSRLAGDCREEVERRFPKVLRRVGGYNLDEFTRPDQAFNLAKIIVGSEGTLAVVLDAKINLVPLPKATAVMCIQFSDLLDALGATPAILAHRPSAVEVMDGFILSYTRSSPRLQQIRESFIEGDPGALLCVEMYDDTQSDLQRRMRMLQEDLAGRQIGDRFHVAYDSFGQAKVWSLREAALGLSMAMKQDAKSLSFVEDTAVAPERLRDYIARFLEIIRSHGTNAGIYAHASVGCLHVRPVVNLKTEEGVAKFRSIAEAVSDLVLEFGGSLSGEHGDGLVRSPFMRKMFGPVLYDAFREIKQAFDPQGIFNPGKIVDAPNLVDNLRQGAGYQTPRPDTWFDYSDYDGLGGAVEMCSGLGACRKKLEGTMCPSYMATREEQHSTRGRANVLRLAMLGRIGEAGLGDDGVYETLDLCLECRACKAECPVGVDMARYKSEFLADYWKRHGTPLHAQAMGHANLLARAGSAFPSLANAIASSPTIKRLGERWIGIDSRRSLPRWKNQTLRALARTYKDGEALLFVDTFTNHYEPEIGLAALDVIAASGHRAAISPNVCCGRPLISKGLLARARTTCERNVERLYPPARAGKRIIFCEPSCLSAVKEDAPALVREEFRERAHVVARASVSFEEYVGTLDLPLAAGPAEVLLHGHCHQKSMGLLGAARSLLERIPNTQVRDLDAGCCGMAGSFGYSKDHYEVSRQIGERKLFPQVRDRREGSVVVAPGFSCRHQLWDFTGVQALHPAMLLRFALAGR